MSTVLSVSEIGEWGSGHETEHITAKHASLVGKAGGVCGFVM